MFFVFSPKYLKILIVSYEIPSSHFFSSNKFLVITFMQCWTNVEGVEPTLYRCYANGLCLLG